MDMMQRKQKKRNKIKGFSLIELLVTVAMMGILLALSLPNFQDTIEGTRSDSQAKLLITTLNLARSEAIRRGTEVSICPSDDSVDCDAGTWTDGWIVFVDVNEDADGDGGSIDGGDIVIRVFDSLGGDNALVGSVDLFQYNARGFSETGGTQTLTLTPSSGNTDNARCVEIGPSGRPRRIEGASC